MGVRLSWLDLTQKKCASDFEFIDKTRQRLSSSSHSQILIVILITFKDFDAQFCVFLSGTWLSRVLKFLQIIFFINTRYILFSTSLWLCKASQSWFSSSLYTFSLSNKSEVASKVDTLRFSIMLLSKSKNDSSVLFLIPTLNSPYSAIFMYSKRADGHTW